MQIPNVEEERFVPLGLLTVRLPIRDMRHAIVFFAPCFPV